MVLPLFFLFLRLSAQTGANQDECKVPNCSPHGPDIRFPFRRKDQPYHCGYPGFEISCKEKEQTILELPYSVKLSVDKINYKSREIVVHDPDFCLQRQLQNLTLSASPFQFKLDSSSFESWIEDYTFFSCSSDTREYAFRSIPCRFLHGSPVYAVTSDRDLDGLDLSSCHKLYNLSLPYGVKEKILIAGVILGFFVLVFVIIILHRVYRSNESKRKNIVRIEKFLEDYKALKPSRYSYMILRSLQITSRINWVKEAMELCTKEKLSNEVLVAIKILNNSKGNGEEFINEVRTIGRIHHVNVVRLVGFCADGVKRALIYEFLPNESLEKFIFSTSVKTHSLGWEKLQDIAIGIAKGIEYLHKDQSAVSMTVARGTMGYIAPEVLSRNFGNASYKSDVYSFGMLLLEMVGGRKNIDVTVETNQIYFPEWVYNQLDQGEDVHIRIEEEGDIK
ncbi:Rust resistance kinase Lr10 [Vitis vinifera]|uniref:Rust resistance kinase Lr10 n=1 Tax=Vitis vinifera TaxID=29760 RepID=A0A438IYR3_VITVI|nr:Rust resistance kinase Lr10 [Vitis vinifera]